jgi:hypothetical protein
MQGLEFLFLQQSRNPCQTFDYHSQDLLCAPPFQLCLERIPDNQC